MPFSGFDDNNAEISIPDEVISNECFTNEFNVFNRNNGTLGSSLGAGILLIYTILRKQNRKYIFDRSDRAKNNPSCM
jgi:hypothetical protein